MSRSIERVLAAPLLVTLVALVASLALHVPAYVGLGLLKALLAEGPPAAPAPPMEIELVESAPREAEDEPSDTAPVALDEEDDRAVRERERERERQATAEAEIERERERQRAEPEPEPAQAQPAQPTPMTRRTSVTHRSRDPSVAPPEDAQYLAEENSRVEEETLARVRSRHLDDPTPQPAASEEATPPDEAEGDAAEEQRADLQDAEGSDERDPTREEARLPPETRPREASRSPTPQVSEAARGDAREGATERGGRPAEAAGGGRQARGGGEVEMREVVVSDGVGTFRVRVPNSRPAGEGEGEGGGLAVAGRGRGSEGEGARAGRAGRSGRRARGGGGAAGDGAPDLRMSWTQFSSLYGEEELRREREAYLEQRRSRTRGESHQRRWERFRAAIEHYDVQARPGNQTALNTRADPFAAYIAAVHLRIHPRFAEGFLVRPPSTVAAALATNPEMHTKLEIGIDAQGRVARIGVIATSGDILFDFGAYNSVMTAQPFGATPEAIRSPDGLVYMHWSFYANHRQCGTFNAEAYILARAAERPAGALPMPGADSVFRPSLEETPDPGARDAPPRAREAPSAPPSEPRPERAAPPRTPAHDHDHDDPAAPPDGPGRGARDRGGADVPREPRAVR